MNTGLIAKSAFRAIARNKLRSGLMMIGVLVGVGSMTVVTALGKGKIEDTMNTVKSTFGATNIYLASGGGKMHGPSRGDGPTTTLTLEDMDAIIARVPGVDMHSPSASVGTKTVTYKGVNRQMRITGHSENAEFLYRGVQQGSFFGSEQVQSSARVALIGSEAAEALFGTTDPIGEQIRIATVPFEIIGVLIEGGIDVHGLNLDDEIFVPVTTAMRRLLNVDHLSAAKLRVKNLDEMETTTASIEKLLRQRHMLGPDQSNDFKLITPVQVRDMVESGNRDMTLFLPMISGIAILVGAFIIASLLLVSVNERRGEIGLRKALGARSKDIQLQFLIESTTITLVAGVLGLALGSVVSQVLLNMQEKPAVLPWEAMLLGLVISVAVGLMAGVIPARRAARLDPVETLR